MRTTLIHVSRTEETTCSTKHSSDELLADCLGIRDRSGCSQRRQGSVIRIFWRAASARSAGQSDSGMNRLICFCSSRFTAHLTRYGGGRCRGLGQEPTTADVKDFLVVVYFRPGHRLEVLPKMQHEQAERLRKHWGNRPCDHPDFVKEYHLGAPTGDYVCTQCGHAMRKSEVQEFQKRRQAGDL